MKKQAFNSLIENKIRKVGLDELNEEKENRSKIKNLIYKELKTQKYLKCKEIGIRRKKLIFKLRTRMIDTPENIGKEVICKLCGLDFDSQTHIIQCIVLKLKCPELLQINQNMNEIIKKGTVTQLNNFSIIYEKALRLRKILLN